ncbi:MAG: hypothetical protein ACFFCW_24555 [Candidatus Hodarchaeota archaeon]
MKIAIQVLGIFVSNENSNEKGASPDDSEKIQKKSTIPAELKETLNRIKWTFWSILIFNYILVAMGVAAFVMAVFSAAGGKFEVAAVFSALGTADVISVFKFSMDRVQRSLGDQVQVETAKCGIINQMEFVPELKSKDKVTIEDVERINEEIRRATLYTMGLIQDFTKIAEPIKEKPWIRTLPIRFEELNFPSEVIIGEMITAHGALRNASNKPITIKCIVIAVRPPHGTPDGGPFRFDFYIDGTSRTLGPGQSYTLTPTKVFPPKKEEIPNKYLGKDWYAFMTCQTEDGCWHDDHNKKWFEVTRK